MRDPGRSLLSRDFALLLAATLVALSNYAPLLSVVPLWASSGGVGGAGVGATTGVMMGATALTQLGMRWFFRVFTLRRMMAAGALLLGLTTPAYLFSTALGPVLLVSAVRGVGFAMVVVAGSALVAELVPAHRLGTGVGVFGLAAGLPNVVALPVGVWFAQEVGFTAVFLVAGALSAAAAPLVLMMPTGSRHTAPPPAAPGGVLPGLVRPSLVFFATAMALGGAMTFLPLALPEPGSASLALFALSLCMITGRYGAGPLGDALGPGRLLLPAAALSAVGTAALALAIATGAGTAVAALGAALFGLGFGAVQNDSLVVIMRRAGSGRHGTASAVWNFAYDGGTGAGAVLLGATVTTAGYPVAFAVAAAAIALAAPAGAHRRRGT